jgi:hypothetical protein
MNFLATADGGLHHLPEFTNHLLGAAEGQACSLFDRQNQLVAAFGRWRPGGGSPGPTRAGPHPLPDGPLHTLEPVSQSMEGV